MKTNLDTGGSVISSKEHLMNFDIVSWWTVHMQGLAFTC